MYLKMSKRSDTAENASVGAPWVGPTPFPRASTRVTGNARKAPAVAATPFTLLTCASTDAGNVDDAVVLAKLPPALRETILTSTFSPAVATRVSNDFEIVSVRTTCRRSTPRRG